MEEIEIWKDIPGYEGKYQVSNLGNVKSMNYMHTKKEHILIKSVQPTGYHTVTFCKNGKAKQYLVHRIVYQTFAGEIPEGMQVNHIDENKLNNNIDNLNLMTPKENCNWGTHIERCSKGMIGKLINNKFRSKKILCVETEIIYPSISEAERQVHINKCNIIGCCKGRYRTAGGYHWKYIE